jgi:hypothetical protein
VLHPSGAYDDSSLEAHHVSRLSQCVDKLRILSEFISLVLLLQVSIHRKHGRKSFLNLISIP